MTQMPRTGGDIVVDNIEYLSDLLSDMLETVERMRKMLPQREAVRDIAFSDDINQVNELNRVMADTSIAVWAAEKAKESIINVFNDLSPDDI